MDTEDATVYRVCFLEIPGVLGVDNKEKFLDGRVSSDKLLFTGSVSKTFSFVTEFAFGSHTINLTAVRSESIGGVMKDGTMTGCYRSMYENETDLSLVLVDYPVHDFKRLDPVQVFFENPAKIISMYHVDPKPSIVYSDIVKSSLASSFSVNTWMTIFMAFIILSVLLWLRGVLVSRIKGVNKKMLPARSKKRIKHKDPQPESISQAVYQTFCHFIRQQTQQFDDFAGSLISIMMTVGFFFITTVFFSLMSTDLVIITRPKTIENYEDIMNSDPSVIPVFSSIFDDTQEFEKANDESVRGRFWKKYKDTYIAGDPYNDFEGDLQIMIESFQGTRPIIMAGLFADGMRKVVCSLKQSLLPKQSNAYSWMSQDPTAEMHHKGLVIRNGLKSTRFIKGFHRRIRHCFEVGLPDIAKREFKQATFGPGMDVDPSIVRECLSDVLKMNDFRVERVVLANYTSLLQVCLMAIALAFAQLFRELGFHQKTAQLIRQIASYF